MAPGHTLGHAYLRPPTLPSITRANTPIMLAVDLQVLLPQEARYVALPDICAPVVLTLFFFLQAQHKKEIEGFLQTAFA